jgi:hypothetical protein
METVAKVGGEKGRQMDLSFWVLRQNLWVKIGQFNGGAGVDFVRDGRTNKWCEAKGALAA